MQQQLPVEMSYKVFSCDDYRYTTQQCRKLTQVDKNLQTVAEVTDGKERKITGENSIFELERHATPQKNSQSINNSDLK